MSHTPGPWTAANLFARPENVPNGWSVRANGHTLSLGVHEADARLIAAAPDLLAVAERYMAEVHIGHAQSMKDGRDHNELCEQARAAIAKAKAEA